MSQFIRFAEDGGDLNAWAAYEEAQNYNGIGINSCRLYNDAGVLKISVGRIGIDNGTKKGTVVIDAIETISIVGVSLGNWAKIEMAVSGTGYIFTATDISGATDYTIIPTEFKQSNIDREKNGFYIDAAKRCIGIVWKTAGGNLSLIYNDNRTIFINNNEKYSIFRNEGTTQPISGVTTVAIPTTIVNDIEGVSLSSNQITLPIGKYKLNAGLLALFKNGSAGTNFQIYNTTSSSIIANIIAGMGSVASDEFTFFNSEIIFWALEETIIELKISGSVNDIYTGVFLTVEKLI